MSRENQTLPLDSSGKQAAPDVLHTRGVSAAHRFHRRGTEKPTAISEDGGENGVPPLFAASLALLCEDPANRAAAERLLNEIDERISRSRCPSCGLQMK